MPENRCHVRGGLPLGTVPTSTDDRRRIALEMRGESPVESGGAHGAGHTRPGPFQGKASITWKDLMDVASKKIEDRRFQEGRAGRRQASRVEVGGLRAKASSFR